MGSEKPKAMQIADSVEAAREYRKQFPDSPAEEYMYRRGLGTVADRFGLGYVGSARTGDERLTGRLVIPYLRPAGGEFAVATLRYRCPADHSCKEHGGDKYKSIPGDYPRLFNTAALIGTSPIVVLTEGEFDAMTWEAVGVPAVAYQGVSAWRPHFNLAFVGFRTVFIIADGDEPGIKAADKRAEGMPNGKVIVMPDGHDSNSFFQEFGADALRGKLGL